jgi:hypothetical protein
MKYIRAQHPAIAWPLLHWFVEGNQTKEEIFAELYKQLSTEPDKVFCEIALKGDRCQGVLIAQEAKDHIWVWQARANKKFDGKKIFKDLCDWAKEKGKPVLKAACSKKRASRRFKMAYGFDEVDGELVKVI